VCVFLCAAAVIEEVAVKPPYHAKGYRGVYAESAKHLVKVFIHHKTHVGFIVALRKEIGYGGFLSDQMIRHILRLEGWWPPQVKRKPTRKRSIKRVIAFQNWTPEKQYQEIETEYCK